MAEQHSFIGIDLGGSNSLAVLYDENMDSVAESKIETAARNGADSVLQRIAVQVLELTQKAKHKVRAVGLGVPGVVSGELVRIAPNLGWKNFRPLDELAKRVSVPCFLLNDVNAGLLGELSQLQPQPSLALAFFCGTGIGGAVFARGRLLEGWHGGAGEVGHLTLVPGGKRCGCGHRGCLEAYAGKWALNRKIRKRLRKKKKTELSRIIDYNLARNPVKSASLKKALEAGDPFTRALIKRYAGHLAHAISLSVNLLNPELIVLGGGLIEAMGKHILPLVDNRLGKYIINSKPVLMQSQLGDYAGPLGAALYAREKCL